MGRTSDTREKLLTAAIELIWASSFGAISVDQICEHAGVKKGSFYHFFPSKEDLALEAFEAHWSEDIQPLFADAFDPKLAPRERIRRWCDAMYAEQKERFDDCGHVPGCPFTSIGSEMGTQSERMRAKAEELLERGMIHLERALRDGKRDGSFRIDDPRTTARIVGTLALGAMLRAKIQNDPEELRALAPQVLGLLGAKPTPKKRARAGAAASSTRERRRTRPSKTSPIES
jgi:TetR/AcrR family transcriptional repressor of nem operon